MNIAIAAIILPIMGIGCLVAAPKFYGGARLFLYGCGAVDLFVLLMILKDAAS